jgi:stringent starvation protein B
MIFSHDTEAATEQAVQTESLDETPRQQRPHLRVVK